MSIGSAASDPPFVQPTRPPPALARGSLVIAAMLTLETAILILHFRNEFLSLDKSCAPTVLVATRLFYLPISILQFALPCGLLLKLRSGRNWARFSFISILLLSEPFLIHFVYRTSSTTLIKSYVVIQTLMIGCCLTLFLRRSNQFYKDCKRIFLSKKPVQPLTLSIGLFISIFGLIGLNLALFLVSLVDVGFEMMGPNSCHYNTDAIYVYCLSNGVVFLAPIPAFLLYNIAAGRNWSRMLHAVTLISFQLFLVFQIHANDLNFSDLELPQKLGLISILLMDLGGLLFFLPGSRHWFKAS